MLPVQLASPPLRWGVGGGVVKSCSPGRCKAQGCEDQQGIKEGRGRTFGGGGSNFSDVRLAMFSMTIALCVKGGP